MLHLMDLESMGTFWGHLGPGQDTHPPWGRQGGCGTQPGVLAGASRSKEESFALGSMGLPDHSGLGWWHRSRNDKGHIQARALRAITWSHLCSFTLAMSLARCTKGLLPPAWVQDDLNSTHAVGHLRTETAAILC